MSSSIEAEIKKYSEQLGKDPKSRAFVRLSDCYRKLGRYEEAIAVAKEGLVHHPTYVGGKMSLARAEFEFGELDAARELLEGVIRFSPDNLMANRLLAEVYVQEGKGAEAIPLLKRLLALEPNDTRAAEQLKSLEGGVPSSGVGGEAPSDHQTEVSATPSPPGPPPVAAATTIPAPTMPPTEGLPKTVTLAEMYRKQGHFEKAREIYAELGMSEQVGEVEKEIAFLRSKKRTPSGGRVEGILTAWLGRIQERRRREL